MTIGYGACPFGKLLQDHARVVGAAKKGSVNPLISMLQGWRRDPDEQNAKDGTYRGGGIGSGWKESREGMGEKGDSCRCCYEQENDIASLHQNISGTALQEYGNLKHSVLYYRIGKGQGHEREGNNSERQHPKREFPNRMISQEGCVEHHEQGTKSRKYAPENDQCLPTSLYCCRTHSVPDKGNESYTVESKGVESKWPSEWLPAYPSKH